MGYYIAVHCLNGPAVQPIFAWNNVGKVVVLGFDVLNTRKLAGVSQLLNGASR